MSEPIKDFTTVIPFWQPRVAPVELENATDEQLEAMKVTVSNTKIGEYTLVLAQDPETLQQRTPLFNGIMYSRGGLSRAERSEEHTSELQSRTNLVCRLLLEKKKK